MPALSQQIPRPRVAAGAALPATTQLPAMLAGVDLAAEQLRDAQAAFDVAVVRARAHGASWYALADVLGMTAKGVRLRYVGRPAPASPVPS